MYDTYCEHLIYKFGTISYSIYYLHRDYVFYKFMELRYENLRIDNNIILGCR